MKFDKLSLCKPAVIWTLHKNFIPELAPKKVASILTLDLKSGHKGNMSTMAHSKPSLRTFIYVWKRYHWWQDIRFLSTFCSSTYRDRQCPRRDVPPDRPVVPFIFEPTSPWWAIEATAFHSVPCHTYSSPSWFVVEPVYYLIGQTRRPLRWQT